MARIDPDINTDPDDDDSDDTNSVETSTEEAAEQVSDAAPEPEPAPAPDQQVQNQLLDAAPAPDPEPADTSVEGAAEQIVDSAPDTPTDESDTTTKTPEEQVQDDITDAAPEPADDSVEDAAEQIVDSAPDTPTDESDTTTKTPDEQVRDQITGAAPEPDDLPARGRGDVGSGPQSTAPQPDATRDALTSSEANELLTDSPAAEVDVPDSAPTESRATNPTTNIQTTVDPNASGPADRTMRQSGDGLIAGGIGSVGGLIGGSAVGQAVLGPSGQTEDYVRGKFTGLGEFSADVATGVKKRVVNPAAGVAGEAVESTPIVLPAMTGVGGVYESPESAAGGVDKGFFDINPETTIGQQAEAAVGGVGDETANIIRAPQDVLAAGNVAGSATNVGLENVKQEGVVEGGAKSASAAGQTAVNVGAGFAAYAQENPAQTLGMLAGGALVGVAGGRLLGTAGRGLKGRVRTAGGTKIDLGDVTQREVIDGDRKFPAAQNRELYKRDPAEAVRRQATDKTPEEIAGAYTEAGVDEGVTLKKAIELEPEGPKAGRAARGLDVPEGGYESPGSFVGPELSPYFLGTQSRAGYSLRPGLPDFGGRPTAAAIRTDVESPDADDLAGLNRELLDAEGQTTARTKPPSEVAPGEIEAIVPPGAKFADIGTGPVRNTLRRLGIGSDYYTTVNGRRVPIRLVADPDDIDAPGSRSFGDLLDDDRAQVGASGGGSRVTRTVDDLSGSVTRPVDRPLPLVPGGGYGSGGSGSPSTTDAPTTTVESDPNGRPVPDEPRPREPTTSPSDIDIGPVTTPFDGFPTEPTANPPTTSPRGAPSDPPDSLIGSPPSDPGTSQPPTSTSQPPSTTPGREPPPSSPSGSGSPPPSDPTLTPTLRTPMGDSDIDDRRREEPAAGSGRDIFDSSLGSGWFNEYLSELAGVSRQSPEQETLEEAAEERQITALPTEGELESEERFDEAFGFFTGEGTAVNVGFDFEDGGEGLL